MDLLFATNNEYKLKEIRALVRKDIRIISLGEMNINENIPETMDTVEGNAIQKATYIFEKYHLNCFADDTGLEVKALDGRPGVYSARFAGEHCSFQDNVNKLLFEMQQMNDRTARFLTIIAFVYNGMVKTFEGIIEGVITKTATGDQGFGYDPVFMPKDFSKTFAEMSTEEKNAISHRGKAVTSFVQYLETLPENINSV